MLLSSRSGRWSVVTFVGAAVLANAGASGAQLPPGDRYLCYKAAVSQTAFVPTTAMLEDQFGRVGYDVRRIRWICNPATQNGELVSSHVIPRPEETVLESFLGR